MHRGEESSGIDARLALVIVMASPALGGGNQSIAELRADYRDLTAEERLAQAARLSKVATELAAEAEL